MDDIDKFAFAICGLLLAPPLLLFGFQEYRRLRANEKEWGERTVESVQTRALVSLVGKSAAIFLCKWFLILSIPVEIFWFLWSVVHFVF